MIRFFTFLRSALSVARNSAVLSGVLAGVLLICAITPIRLLLGTSHEVDTAMLLSAAVCCWLIHRFTASTKANWLQARWGMVLTAAWVNLIPRGLSTLMAAGSMIPTATLENSTVAYTYVSALTLVCLLPVLFGLRQSQLQMTESSSSPLRSWRWLLGLTVACTAIPTFVMPYIGTGTLSLIALLLAAGHVFLMRWIPAQESVSAEQTVHTIEAEQTGKPADWIIGTAAFSTGVALALAAFVASQLISRNLIGDFALLAGIALGVGLTIASEQRRLTSARSPGLRSVCMFLAAWAAFLAAAYPLLTFFCLYLNARVSNIAALYAGRMVLLMFLTLPAGFLFRRLSSLQKSNAQTPLVPLLLLAGFITAAWLPVAPHIIATALGVVGLCLAGCVRMRGEKRSSLSRRQQIGMATLGGTAAIGLIFSGNLDPSRSERVLYNPAALQSYRQGIAPAQLSWIDDSRQLVQFTSLTDHVSLWRTHGSQLQLRRNNLTLGMHSVNTEVCPHHAGDLLPALLPLAFHPAPERVLVLGLHPATLLTCHRWPLQTVDTVDGQAHSREMLKWMLTQEKSCLHLSNGPAFRYHKMDPILSLNSRHAVQYDLITCPVMQPLAPETSAQMTREFYMSVRSHLSDGGIFSQRIPYYDLGPEVIRNVTATMQSVFEEVVAVESIPGELIYLCSAGQLPPVDQELVNRLKLPQCRTLLGEAGWDWSLILGRGGIDHAGLREFCMADKQITTSWSNRLACGLAVEVSRWGRKGDATRNALSQHGDALRAKLADETSNREVADRLEDLNLAHQIQRDHPNDPWAYRAALKTRLQERPRAAILPVNHQLKRVLDPEDQRRKDYLTTLGPAAKNPQPSWEQINELTQFEAPFDPLVSLFLYFETANLLERCQPAIPGQQLTHLLHTVYFSSGYDQSVRNVGNAMNLLCQQENLMDDDVQRWDEVNSLMQVLAQRWQMRINSHKTSKYESADTEHSLAAIEQGLKVLEKDYRKAGLSDTEWAQRKLTLEQALFRPLRQHRSVAARATPLIPVVASEKSEAEATAK